jgi:ribosomal protein L7/L12
MNFNAITNEQKDRIIDCGLELLAAITDAYGVEDGHATWDRLSEVVGTEFKHAVFMDMLSGKTTSTITLYGKNCRQDYNFVSIIKQIRFASGLGLREAKDIADELDSGVSKTLKLDDGVNRHTAIDSLRKAGLRVS